MEVGYGRVDIILFPKDEIKGEDILELKRANSENTEKEVEKDLKQIEDEKYYTELKRDS